MSEKIYAAITDDFVRRMRNWAKAGAGLLRAGSGAAISSCYSLGVRVDRYRSFDPPVLHGEADDVSAALLAVPIRYRQAVEQFWRYEGAPLRWHARHCRQALSYHTFEAWVLKGHELLLAEMAARSRGFHASVIANQNAVARATSA